MLYFYSTSNHNKRCASARFRIVVLYFYSTSNHNKIIGRNLYYLLCYISILHQTTTRRSVYRMPLTLCYISILHQTTTLGVPEYKSHLLCYISILHQTTTLLSMSTYTRRCVIFLFYIKPQRRVTITLRGTVVLYFYSTSNHNNVPRLHKVVVVVLYFYSTSNHNQMMDRFYPNRVVLYFYSTSNHNSHEYTNKMHELCYISILHQTTTRPSAAAIHSLLCYISILHQTTTSMIAIENTSRLCYISILHQTTTSGGLSVDNAPFMLQIGCPKMCLRDPKKRK